MMHLSGLILTALTSLLQLVSMMHFNWAKLVKKKSTIVPDHDLISWVSWCFPTSNDSKNVSLVDHFYNANACSKLSR